MARLLLSVSYEELGLGSATIEQLHKEIAGFAASQCLRLFSTLNALLRHPTELINPKAHNALLKWLFPEPVAAKILKSGRPALHRQQLLYMAKEAAVSCEGKERDWTKADYEKIELLCLMGSDLLPTIPKEASSHDLQRFVRFVLHFAPIDEAAVHHPEHNIARAYLMLTKSSEKLRNSKMFVDVKQVFERAAGLATDDYFALMLAILTRFFKFDEVAYANNPASYAIDAAWFGSVKIDEKTVSKVLEDISATPLQLVEQGKKETGPADFTVFRNRPLVRDGESFYPVDFEFLATKTEAHIYWTVLRSLSSDDQGKFQAFWGKLFEEYITDLLTS